MVDFLVISHRPGKRGVVEIYPTFNVGKSNDLMIRGGDFYAIWLENEGLWSRDEDDVIRLIDKELDIYAEKNKQRFDSNIRVLYMRNSESCMIDSWHKYCQKQQRDSYHTLDKKLIFSNSKTGKRDYASRRLPYPLEEGSIDAYDELMTTLYSPEERHKIEWAIGSIVTGDSKKIQKFFVLYGAPGTGKSTVLKIIQKMFDGYCSAFDAKALASSSNAFALEAFKSDPLIAIQHDGDLSKIEDNARLNSLVSHEEMMVNEKFKATYATRFEAMIFMGTNKPVKITDAKSGLLRRLIDVTPTGDKLTAKEYDRVMKQIEFELGAIAYHCRDVYLENPRAYDSYVPTLMLGASNDFYNFVADSFYIFKREDGTTLKAAWEMYKIFCEETKVPFIYPQRTFKEELKNYFRNYDERVSQEDGSRVRNYYSGFRTEKFEKPIEEDTDERIEPRTIVFDSEKSLLDEELAACPAQYANDAGTPERRWDEVTTRLSEIDTKKLHYVRVPKNHIVIDFDIPDESGNKSFERNLEAASKWPPTYAELSKSAQGIHLHYIYKGDVSKLKAEYAPHIEIKVFSGKSSLRRKLTKCNKLPIAEISSGLPLKGEDAVVNFEGIKNEKALRTKIRKNLNKEYIPHTKPSMDLIFKDLEEAYKSGIHYDVSDMRPKILAFAANSSHQADYCLKLIGKMQFKSDEPADFVFNDDRPIVFYDVEVFPNLLLVNWKYQDKDKKVVRMINPTPTEVAQLCENRLIGFNNRRYDNHILYARIIGKTNAQIYEISKKIVSGKQAFFGEAYNLSYTDIYDFSAKKQSLKKWEIEMGIHHQELGLPWDQPVPEEKWEEVAEYCDNDVIATEAVFGYLQEDWTARQILADIAGMSVNDTTNTLTGRIIFGTDRNPQRQFNYRFMGDMTDAHRIDGFDEYTQFDSQNRPVFPGYTFELGKSFYRDICPENPDPKRRQVGEGGCVYAEPGIYWFSALLDIASMHPNSLVNENLFGKYTKNFQELLDIRLYIKHREFDKARELMDGRLAKYLEDETKADQLSTVLKIPINAVYGLTSASFVSLCRDPRNKDNIVAKRGALFMINLRHEVQNRGYTVAHIKTDSIKIPNATPEIIQFVMDYGKLYGYTFEHEATYERMCLVNDAVYIAKYATVEQCESLYGAEYVQASRDCCKKNKKRPGEWTATGTQFAVPYVFKTLFSKEPIVFSDLCETKSVTSAIYLDMVEGVPDGEHDYNFIGRVGQFCPIKPGHGGGVLCREAVSKTGEKKYDAVVGTKNRFWLESEVVETLGKQDDIDRSYYDDLVDDAVKTISEYGDFDQFISGEPPVPDIPPWEYDPWSEANQFSVR